VCCALCASIPSIGVIWAKHLKHLSQHLNGPSIWAKHLKHLSQHLPASGRLTRVLRALDIYPVYWGVCSMIRRRSCCTVEDGSQAPQAFEPASASIWPASASTAG
jgi:hypothetical protein